MEIRELLRGIETIEIKASLDTEAKGIVQDSRKIEDGFVFVAIKGVRSDGNEYISSALAKGAVCVVTDVAPKSDIPYILVHDARQTLSLMLSNFYNRPQDSFEYTIGVTGTNGKTSTTLMLKNIFEETGRKVGLIGTMKYLIGDREIEAESEGNHLTTPDTENFWKLLALMRDEGVEVLIMEVSSHALALDKVYGIRFSCAAFTNLTQDHLDFHHDFDSYLEAKAKLFNMCDVGVLNGDDKASEKIRALATCPVVTYSIDNIENDFTAKNVKLKGALGVEYELLSEGLIFRVRVDIPGTFTVYNSMTAASVALTLGVSYDKIVKGFERTHRIQGRIDRVDIDAPYSVIIDFAHTPDAMVNVINTVKAFAEGRIIALFGCGGDRDRTKRPIMGSIATEMCDLAIITSDNSRSEDKDAIIKDILEGVKKDNYKVVPDRREAILYALSIAEKGDVILCLGKGHEEYEIDTLGKHRFSEYEIVVENYKKV